MAILDKNGKECRLKRGLDFQPLDDITAHVWGKKMYDDFANESKLMAMLRTRILDQFGRAYR